MSPITVSPLSNTSHSHTCLPFSLEGKKGGKNNGRDVEDLETREPHHRKSVP